MRLSRLAVLAGLALFASATTAVEYAEAQSRSSGSRSSSYSSSSRSSSSSYRSTPSPSRSYSAPTPARAAEPRPIRAVAPPTARPVTRDASAAAPRPIRAVAPPSKASPDVALRSQASVAPKAINPRPTTTARPAIVRASRPPAYVGSNGQSRSFSPPPRHSRYGNTYYGSRPYRSGGSDYYPVYGSGPGMGDVLLWMVVADALSDNGERRINCEYPANASDTRICADARRDAARQVGAVSAAAPTPAPKPSNSWGWILGSLALLGLLGGGIIWFNRRR
jgi:hypothetical protein